MTYCSVVLRSGTLLLLRPNRKQGECALDLVALCRASDGIGKFGLRSYVIGDGRGNPNGKVPSSVQSPPEGGNLTAAFNRTGAYLGAVREASDSADFVLPMAKTVL